MQQESLGKIKRSSPRNQLAGIITHLSVFQPCLSVMNPLHPCCRELVKNIELRQITSLPQQYATNYSYLQGLSLF